MHNTSFHMANVGLTAKHVFVVAACWTRGGVGVREARALKWGRVACACGGGAARQDRTSRDHSYSTHHQDASQNCSWLPSRDEDACRPSVSVKRPRAASTCEPGRGSHCLWSRCLRWLAGLAGGLVDRMSETRPRRLAVWLRPACLPPCRRLSRWDGRVLSGCLLFFNYQHKLHSSRPLTPLSRSLALHLHSSSPPQPTHLPTVTSWLLPPAPLARSPSNAISLSPMLLCQSKLMTRCI